MTTPNPTGDALKAGTISVSSFDGHCVRVDFSTRAEADAFADRIMMQSHTPLRKSDAEHPVFINAMRDVRFIEGALAAMSPSQSDNGEG